MIKPTQSAQELEARLLSREQAAAYCSLSPGTFSRWVSQGLLPKAILGTARWDLKAIDSAIDSLSGLEQIEQSALDLWRAKRARRFEGNS
jgi:predicted DNA-binding transcriptional regulator AlpA